MRTNKEFLITVRIKNTIQTSKLKNIKCTYERLR